MGKPRMQLGNITRRDDYILRQALAFAIEGLNAAKYPPLSDIDDMKRILAFMCDLPIIETDEGAVLPSNSYVDRARIELANVFRNPDLTAKAKALAHAEAHDKACAEALAKGQ